MDWQPIVVLTVVAVAALFLLKRSMSGSGKTCGHGCGCGKPAHQAPEGEHWVGDLQVRPKDQP